MTVSVIDREHASIKPRVPLARGLKAAQVLTTIRTYGVHVTKETARPRRWYWLKEKEVFCYPQPVVHPRSNFQMHSPRLLLTRSTHVKSAACIPKIGHALIQLWVKPRHTRRFLFVGGYGVGGSPVSYTLSQAFRTLLQIFNFPTVSVTSPPIQCRGTIASNLNHIARNVVTRAKEEKIR